MEYESFHTWEMNGRGGDILEICFGGNNIIWTW